MKTQLLKAVFFVTHTSYVYKFYRVFTDVFKVYSLFTTVSFFPKFTLDVTFFNLKKIKCKR